LPVGRLAVLGGFVRFFSTSFVAFVDDHGISEFEVEVGLELRNGAGAAVVDCVNACVVHGPHRIAINKTPK
jgi:hypothetical protein